MAESDVEVEENSGIDRSAIDFEALGAQLMHANVVGSRSCDAVFTHPGTGASLYIGNIEAAQNADVLAQHNISRVVNCQDIRTRNFFEDNAEFAYCRFPVARWQSTVLAADGNTDEREARERVLEYMQPLFEFCDSALESGHSVLVHCRAGAHRAGTVGTAYLMRAMKVNYMEALAIAKTKRPIVDPFTHLLSLLEMLSQALGHEPLGESVDEIARAKYQKMIKMRIPRASVEQKMRAHGHESMIPSLWFSNAD